MHVHACPTLAAAGACSYTMIMADMDTLHAEEVKQQIRLGFEAHRGETEEYACKFLLSDGRAQLKQLRETFMLQE